MLGGSKLDYSLKTVDIELSAHCNFMCEFCPYSDITRAKGQIDVSLAKQVLDELSEKQICNNIGISQMGEPFLYKKLPEVIGYAHTKGLNTHVITNGSLLTEEMAGALFENGLDKLLISYHTPDEESFNSLRKESRINFHEYEEMIFNVLKLKVNKNYHTEIIMNFMFSGDVPFKIPRCVDNFQELYYAMRKWILRLSKVYGEINEDKLINYIKQLKRDIGYYNYFEVLPGIKFSVGLVYRWANWLLKKQGVGIIPKKHGHCNMPFERLMVLWNGDVTFCCGDYDGKLVIGNVRKESIEKIYNGRLMEIRKEFERGILSQELCQICRGRVKFHTIFHALDYSHCIKGILLSPSILRLLLSRVKKRAFLLK